MIPVETDPYLSDEICILRLLDEYRKHNNLIVAVDFDGTINDFHKVGANHYRVISLVQRAQKLGCIITIFTDLYKGRLEEVKELCQDWAIRIDYINDSPPEIPYGKNGKFYYNILLDDRAGLASAFKQLNAVITYLELEKARGQNA